MTPESLAAALRDVLITLVADGSLDVDVPDTILVERPRSRDHGDYASNVALTLAKKAGQPPRDLATLIASRLSEAGGVSEVAIAGPGFLNITVDRAAQGELAQTIVEAGPAYGRSEVMSGVAVNVEFISANPTGPIHLGHARWAAVGDAIARVLEATGARVAREFYINDRGVQMDRFGQSIAAAAVGEDPPEDGYHGEYIKELADEIVAEHPEYLDLTGPQRMEAFREAGYSRQLAQQQQSLDDFRTHFDLWFSERTLHASGAVDHGYDRFREQGYLYEADGAVWLRTSAFDDDKDRVLVKADGEATYFASDTAYYVDKRERGYDICLYLLGADHHGYVNRLRAVAACAGDDPDYNIEIPIGQMVKMTRGGKEVRLSKRAGNIITITDLVDEVGVDAARYSLIRYPVDSPLTLDLDLLVSRTSDNPVFYVQYAHARISSVLRNAVDQGIDWRAMPFDSAELTHERESQLLAALAEFPRILASAAELREPHRVARYLEQTATAYHKFYDSCRVLPRADDDVTAQNVARLWLCAATRQVIANGLGLLGVDAPERM